MVLSRIAFILLILLPSVAFAQTTPVGMFEAHGDIGVTPKSGSTELAPDGSYRVTGGGANVWGAADAFQFAWKKMSGDITITADIHFEGVGAVEHRKAMLMIRQSLDPGSPYADIALHGVGLTSLQYRPTAGAATQEVRSTLNGPVRIRIERRGDQFTVFAGAPGQDLTPSGPVTVALGDSVLVGIGVCSHDANVLETATFSNLKIETTPHAAARQLHYRSRVTVYDTADQSTRVIYTADQVFEAPNWSPDGKYLLINSNGALYRLNPDAAGAQPEPLKIDSSFRCNNDKTISPDGKLLAFSCSTATSHGSQVYLASADGANAKLMVAPTPSYFHGWSPDGKWMTFVSQRNGNFDLFRIAAAGGAEERLTSSPGYDDGPDYSPDGKWIYFNSDRSGSWDIWRMPPEGAGANDSKAQRVTSDELEDWFPHPSPDGKWLLFLTFPKGTSGHNDKLSVQLRMMPLPGNKIEPVTPRVIASFFGGQGTINVNSWSPDSKRFAYVEYQPLD